MWHAVPVKYFLFLLCSNAIVLVQEVKERTFGLFKRRICARLEVAQIREDAFLELFRVLNRASKGLEPKGKTSHDIGTRDVKEVVPTSMSELAVAFYRF